jgi:NAD(P)-dependent dehydrogenase (short-subunit alcohol dehydrogenase family)
VQDCLSITEDEHKKTMKVNVTTPWFLIKAISKRFRDAQSGGSIVCLTQIIGAERGLYPGAAAYGTSLGAVHQLVRVSLIWFLLPILNRKHECSW